MSDSLKAIHRRDEVPPSRLLSPSRISRRRSRTRVRHENLSSSNEDLTWTQASKLLGDACRARTRG